MGIDINAHYYPSTVTKETIQIAFGGKDWTSYVYLTPESAERLRDQLNVALLDARDTQEAREIVQATA